MVQLNINLSYLQLANVGIIIMHFDKVNKFQPNLTRVTLF